MRSLYKGRKWIALAAGTLLLQAGGCVVNEELVSTAVDLGLTLLPQLV